MQEHFFLITQEQDVDNPYVVHRRLKYNSYTNAQRMEIGKFAHENSTAEALLKFGSQYHKLTESTVRSFRDKYIDSLIGRKVGHHCSHSHVIMLETLRMLDI